MTWAVGERFPLSVFDMGEVMVVAYETVQDQRSDVSAYIFQQPTVDDEELQLLAQLHDGHSTIALTERVHGGRSEGNGAFRRASGCNSSACSKKGLAANVCVRHTTNNASSMLVALVD